MKAEIAYIFVSFFFLPTILFAQPNSIFNTTLSDKRNKIIDKELNKVEQKYKSQNTGSYDLQERGEAIEKTFRAISIELTMEYIFDAHGEQNFEVIDSQGRRISRLHYPHSGPIIVYKGEIRFLPRVSIGGRYGSSLFKRTTATDTDWWPPIADVWWESNSRTKAEVETYDVNLYYRFLDLNKEQIKEKYLSSPGICEIFDFLRINNVESIALDIFAGYQQQKGRYGTTELVDTVEWWTPVNIPYDGLDSFYKIIYQGPRLGLRGEGSFGKFNTRLSLAYAWLKTKAYGWWNKRNYSFEQNGRKGYGIDIGIETTYKLTPNFSTGVGFNYLLCKQERLTESGNLPGAVYQDLDIIRNANSRIYGLLVLLKYIW